MTDILCGKPTLMSSTFVTVCGTSSKRGRNEHLTILPTTTMMMNSALLESLLP